MDYKEIMPNRPPNNMQRTKFASLDRTRAGGDGKVSPDVMFWAPCNFLKINWGGSNFFSGRDMMYIYDIVQRNYFEKTKQLAAAARSTCD